MMYVHFCKNCNKIYTLNGHKQFCPKCSENLKELEITYMDFLALTPKERSLMTDFHRLDSHSMDDHKTSL